MTHITVHFEERCETFTCSTKVGELIEVRLKPLGQTSPGRHVTKPRVQEDDGAMVSGVPDDPAHRLVGGSEGLKLIPLLAGHLARLHPQLVIQELPLELDPGVLVGGVGEAGDEDGSAPVISKVQTLGHFTSTHGHEAGSPSSPDLLVIL